MTSHSPHVVVDGRMAMDGGIGTYLQALVPRLAVLRPQWKFTVIGDVPVLRGLGWDRQPNVSLASCRAPIFSVREQLEIPVRVGSDAELYWAPNYNVPALMRVPVVVTIHDVNHLALPELMEHRVRATYARWLLTSTVTKARRILFDSEFSQRETERLLGRSCPGGTVVHAAVDEAVWAAARHDAPERPIAEPYFLYVGNLKRHKNVPFLLRAFRQVQDALPHRLILIGRTEGLRADPEVGRILPALGGRAQLLGEVPAPVLRRYVAHADALVTASLYEGFGLPPLEAMAAGCPCVLTTAGSVPEICGDAALYCDPRDENSFASGMLRIARDQPLRESLIARGRGRAAQFNWDRSAGSASDVLDQALAAT